MTPGSGSPGPRREPGAEYRCATGLADLEQVANSERMLPPEWISADGADVLPAFVEYAVPLTGPIEAMARLEGPGPSTG